MMILNPMRPQLSKSPLPMRLIWVGILGASLSASACAKPEGGALDRNSDNLEVSDLVAAADGDAGGNGCACGSGSEDSETDKALTREETDGPAVLTRTFSLESGDSDDSGKRDKLEAPDCNGPPGELGDELQEAADGLASLLHQYIRARNIFCWMASDQDEWHRNKLTAMLKWFAIFGEPKAFEKMKKYIDSGCTTKEEVRRLFMKGAHAFFQHEIAPRRCWDRDHFEPQLCSLAQKLLATMTVQFAGIVARCEYQAAVGSGFSFFDTPVK